jgi:phytoene synthase
MTCSLEESQAYCHALMRRAAGNFYYGMRLLPSPKRHAMHALYAWMRYIDDLADGPEGAVPGAARTSEAAEALEHWRQQTCGALAGEPPSHMMLPALAAAVRTFNIPLHIFDDAIAGQLQDLRPQRYESFEELYTYCYRVASTVGIAAVCIWRYSEAAAVKLAEYRGIAMQLTNILRDLREDAARGRVYLPAEDLRAYGVSDVAAPSPALADLIAFEARRARRYYDDSARLESLVAPDARATLRTMTAIYGGILDKIERDPLAVLQRRVSLSPSRKVGEVLRQFYLDQKGAFDA